jgi:hypothetical protein
MANYALDEHCLELALGSSQTRRIQPPKFGGSWLARSLDDMLYAVRGSRRRGGDILKKHLRELALKSRQPITGGGGETGGGSRRA